MLDEKAVAPTITQGGSLRLTFPGTAEAVQQVLLGLSSDFLLRSLNPDARDSAQIVLAEVLNNVVEHAYVQHEGQIDLALQVTDGRLVCDIRDSGLAMPGLSLPDGRLASYGAVADLPEGGFGWFLIRSLTQDLRYERASGQNHLTFCMFSEQ